MTRIIECQVSNEYVKGAGVVAGAAGSHHDVVLRLKFGEMWDGLTKSIVWHNAKGLNPVVTLITGSMLVPGTTDTYDVLIPAEPKEFEGDMVVSIKGSTTSAGTETRATMSAIAKFKILPSKFDAAASATLDINATAAEQLQAQLDERQYNLVANGDDSLRINSLAELKAQLTTWFNAMTDSSVTFFWVYISTAFSGFKQGDYLVRLMRASDTYADAQFSKGYGVIGSLATPQRYRYSPYSEVEMTMTNRTWLDPVLVKMRLETYDAVDRLVSPDIPFIPFDGGMMQFKATSAMRESTGWPGADGHILHLAWDGQSDLASQLFIPHGANVSTNVRPKLRGSNNGSWTGWKDLAYLQDLTGLAPLSSPSFTGEPTAPTAEAGTNNDQIATTAFVQTAVEQVPTAFIAVKGQTTYVSVAEAISMGKAVFAYDPDDDRYYVLCGGTSLGDVDLDGDVDADDNTRLARHVSKTQLIKDPQSLTNGDMTLDGSLNATDLTRIARIVASAHTTTLCFMSFDGMPYGAPVIKALYLSGSNDWAEKDIAVVEATSIAPYFVPGNYEAGDCCLFRGELYKAKGTVVETDGWTPAQWQKTTILDELNALRA